MTGRLIGTTSLGCSGVALCGSGGKRGKRHSVPLSDAGMRRWEADHIWPLPEGQVVAAERRRSGEQCKSDETRGQIVPTAGSGTVALPRQV